MSQKREDWFHHVQDLRVSKMTSSLFSITVIAYWDNVMGPMVSKIWEGNDKVVLCHETVNYVSNHTLSGELCRQTDKQTVDPKLCILPDLGYLFNAFIFNGHSKMGPTITSLSFIIAYDDLPKFLLMQNFIEKQVKILILKYRVFQQKDVGSAIRCIAPYLKKLVKTIDSLQQLNIPPEICISKTVFGESEEAATSLLLDSRFLMRALTSHLQTCGCTIVVGESYHKVNLMIHTLSIFLHKNECFCSRVASEENSENFAQDLWLQGIVGDIDVKIGSKDVLLNTSPVTLIDVDEKTVKQTIYANVHALKRRENWKTEASMLLCGTELSDFPISIRRNHIENFKQILQRKATVFLAYVEHKSNSGRNILNQGHLQRLKQDLSLSCESDFRVILATAEKLRPGLSMFLAEAIQQSEESFQAILEAL